MVSATEGVARGMRGTEATVSAQENFAPTSDERQALSRQAGDTFAAVAADGIVQWWSDGLRPSGVPLASALVPEDARLVPAVLADSLTGPHWLRLMDAQGHGRWMAVLAIPRDDGWLVEFRDVRTLGPAVPQEGGGIADREQVLNEIAWLLSATPRTGKETAVVTCSLEDLPALHAEHGRRVSDEVVTVLLGRISDTLRSGDLVARIDAGQLVVILRGVHDLKGALRVVERIQAEVNEPVLLPIGDIEQSMSAGVTLIQRGESVDSVLDRAEGALELAVQAGANRIITSPPL